MVEEGLDNQVGMYSVGYVVVVIMFCPLGVVKDRHKKGKLSRDSVKRPIVHAEWVDLSLDEK